MRIARRISKGATTAAVLLAVAMSASACSGPSTPPDAGSPPASTESATTASETRPSTGDAASGTRSRLRLSPALVADLEIVLERHAAARPALAIAPVGADVSPAVIGDAEELIAWSTAKVPLAQAVVEHGGAMTHRADLEAALTRSDNGAAGRLWDSLGTPGEAAAATDRALRSAGDRRTRTRSTIVRPGWSAFGQTPWRLDDQARFTAGLACADDAAPVRRLLGQVVASQRWGLGAVPRARLKGGWGATDDGYVVRQLGILPTPGGGSVAVTVQVRLTTGGLDEGVAVVDDLTSVLTEHRRDLPGGRC
ncbi:hypothetical protein [Janibacter sp. G1551]|uniref:hypothetical protein n=1 Tax=Janibacter sp. G1551 TaxID=3420440 RepID=UPI003CFE36A8